ncbi:MAG: hypothetical protein K2Z81_18915 [Cyanobacteria bacterium]|nr:hypothetical protein [Cyanobacteriota bacterium]
MQRNSLTEEKGTRVPEKMKHNLPGKTNVLQVDYNLAGLLCYAPLPPLNLIVCALWLFTEPKENKFLRFHAIQGLIFFTGLVALCFVNSLVNWFSGIPILGGLFWFISCLFGIGIVITYLAGSVGLMLKAHNREMYKLPWGGNFAESKM